jgi:Holliday junction DNA helicase RuvA|tara:strand:+ start:102 stop:692 length:591 start_codon:yes stop_codon:yes gene_type:complete
MIDQISGKIISINDNYVVLEVGGLGIKVNISANFASKLVNEDLITLVTYLNVREDALDLYGFKNDSERNLFLMLISISGIGPKLAVSILSGVELDELKLNILSGDIKSLTSIPGVGAKTAKRIIIELKDKLSKTTTTELGFEDDYSSNISKDVLSALVGLGYSESMATEVIKRINPAKSDKSIESLIKESLKILNE